MVPEPALVSRDTDGDPEDPEEGERQRCPECGSRYLLADERHGDTVCARCGLVVDEGAIDPGPDWRAFDQAQRQDRARAGPGRTILRHDHGLGSRVGTPGEGSGSSGGKTRAQIGRLRKYHRQASYQGSGDRGLQRALTEIQRIAGALDLPETVSETAATIYRKARGQNFLHGRGIEATAAAAVYSAARLQSVPRTLDEVTDVAQAEENAVARTVRRLSQELELPVPPTDPRDLLPAFASRVDAPAGIEQEARELIEQLPGETVAGKKPSSIAAAALYAAAKANGVDLTQSDVAEAADVTEVTVRARLEDLPDPDRDGA